MNSAFQPDTLDVLNSVIKRQMTIGIGTNQNACAPSFLATTLPQIHADNLRLIIPGIHLDTRLLLQNQMLKKIRTLVTPQITMSLQVEQRYCLGELDIEFNPIEFLIKKLTSGTTQHTRVINPLNKATVISNGSKLVIINGKHWISEPTITVDIALIQAKKADYNGNILFDENTEPFNLQLGLAASLIIAEVEQIVPQLSSYELSKSLLTTDKVIERPYHSLHDLHKKVAR